MDTPRGALNVAAMTDDQLAAMPHDQLYQLRDAAPAADQDRLAGFEHRAFARQAVGENPLMSVPITLASVLYQGAKALPRQLTGLRSRSGPSFDQLGQELRGVGEGLGIMKTPQAYADGGLVLPQGITPTMLENLARTRGLPPGLLPAVLTVESGGNKDAVSPKGAVGIAQLMPKTAAMLGVDPRDPQQAIVGAADYLAQLLHQFGDVPTALAAWNWGPGHVARKGTEHLPPETHDFIVRVGAHMAPAAPATPQKGVELAQTGEIGDEDEDYGDLIASLLGDEPTAQPQPDEEQA